MSIYTRVQNLRPNRSVFNLSYEKKFTAELAQLIPVMHDEVVPGDTFKIGCEAVIRFLPMVTPILHEINAYVHYFFVPYRLLWDDWEDFITGGVDGDDSSTLPTWVTDGGSVTNDDGTTIADYAVKSLWDYFGFPTGTVPADAFPVDFPKRAYNLIWNEYYRDQTQMAELNITTSEIVKNRCWEKDFFTSALPWQQRGTAPALPISGSSAAVFAASASLSWPAVGTANQAYFLLNNGTKVPYDSDTKTTLEAGLATKTTLDNNTVDLSSATTFDVSDLRLAFQIQKWMERNARSGARYVEFLAAHFGVAPRDDRLQRPEYIGGTKFPVIISEVIQTSMTSTTPQGTMVGHGLSAGRDFCASYTSSEFGIIIGLLSVMPRSTYGQGINRQWLKETRYDYYSPEWAHLSEQAVIRAELYATGTGGDNTTIFGYQGRYNEMRSKPSFVCGQMRYGQSYQTWHLGRQFASAPSLNETFLRCVPRKDYLAATSAPTILVNFANIIKAIRPLPVDSNPGLIDHA